MAISVNNNEVGEFDWNESNIKKNEIKHGVFYKECKEVFLNEPLVLKDQKHSVVEKRFNAIGKTNSGKLLFISFTMRILKVRVISARTADKKERMMYEKTKKATKI